MASNGIYTGVWRNWNGNSSDAGLVLTVSPQSGPYIIAFIALFVSLAMSHLWTILCFAMHQVRATDARRSGFHHQLQALLSNSQSSASVLCTLLRMMWRWRSKPVGAVRDSMLVAATAIVHLALLVVATLLSSRVVSAGDEVLARGQGRCGWIYGSNSTQMSLVEKLNLELAGYGFGRWISTQSMKYVRACYEPAGSTKSESCKAFTTPSLPLSVDPNFPCPFSSRICAIPSAIQVATGFIDSNHDLGINTPKESRVQIKKILTCVPILAEERFSSNWTTIGPDGQVYPQYSFKYYHLGPTASTNFTWSAINSSFDYFEAAYALGVQTSASGYYSDYYYSSFSPIPELQVNNSDVSILFLKNNAVYPSEVQDPWFRATSPLDSGSDLFKTWGSDRSVSALGCTEQYQFCNSSHCSEPNGILLNKTLPYVGLSLDETQKAVFNLLFTVAAGVNLYNGVNYLGSQLLLAQDQLISGVGSFSGPPPDQQWHSEVRNFANIMMAALQRLVVDFASPPDIAIATVPNGTTSSRAFVTFASDDGERNLCNSVRIRDSSYFNFSVAGLAIILSLSLSIMVFNVVCVPGLVFWVRRKLRLSESPRLTWLEGRVFRLLRTAFQNNAGILWEVEKDSEIPVTKGDNVVFFSVGMWETPRRTRKESQSLQLLETNSKSFMEASNA